MRQIKFRVWDTVNKNMFVPSSINFKGNTVWICDSHGENKFEYELENENSKLMQFTGLLDKNGKEIYEGDIVKTRFEVFSIEWFKDNACFIMSCVETGKVRWFENREVFSGEFKFMSNEVEIIGNICEHPNLLNKEK